MTQNSKGLTLVELLVAMAVAGLVAAAAMSITFSSRAMYESDERRTELNQHLRAGLDLVGIDVRQAGTRLPSDFPALMIVDGGTGPDTLVIRTNESDDVMPICQDITVGNVVASLQIAQKIAPAAGCAEVPDNDSDGWPDNVDAWRGERAGKGGAIDVYAFNPLSKGGQFIVYDGDGADTDRLKVTSSTTWVISCSMSDQCRAYALDEHRYQLNSGRLSYTVNEDPTRTVNILDHVVDFQVVANMADGSTATTLTSTDDWSQVTNLEITLTGEVAFDGRTIRREMTTRFFPRNVLSL